MRVTREPNYGVCCGETDSQWGCFILHNAVEPPFKIFVTLVSKCTPPRGDLKYGFHSHKIRIYLNFIMLAVCNSDVSRAIEESRKDLLVTIARW
jgi:hypothetical protein